MLYRIVVQVNRIRNARPAVFDQPRSRDERTRGKTAWRLALKRQSGIFAEPHAARSCDPPRVGHAPRTRRGCPMTGQPNMCADNRCGAFRLSRVAMSRWACRGAFHQCATRAWMPAVGRAGWPWRRAASVPRDAFEWQYVRTPDVWLGRRIVGLRAGWQA